jgi:formylglycine-generating enzyme required for sulfatase activity
MTLLTSHPLANGCPPVWASAWGQDQYGPWVALRVGEVEQRLRWIPPGWFLMGSPEDDREAIDREKPQHEVQLTKGFWLFDTPCTQALWQAVMGTDPSRFKGEQRPVEQVSWQDCQEFITKLNVLLPGLSLRLPTEAEWEYACRAGTDTPRYAQDLDAIAWYGENSGRETHPVGQKDPNAWGLYDMLGNVDEWCHDGQRVYTQEPAIDPIGPLEPGVRRVIRGGFWNDSARNVRAAYRYWIVPGSRYGSTGFRCASSGTGEKQASWAAEIDKIEKRFFASIRMTGVGGLYRVRMLCGSISSCRYNS